MSHTFAFLFLIILNHSTGYENAMKMQRPNSRLLFKTQHTLIALAEKSIRQSIKSYANKCVSFLKVFSDKRLVAQGTAFHGHLVKTGLSSQKYIAVKLLIMYLNYRKSVEINQMLKEFNGFDVVVHNCLINANIEWGDLKEAQKLFLEMPQRNEVTWTILVSGFLKYGRVEDAMSYFEMNPGSTMFSWTAVISGLVRNGYSFQGIKVFLRMLEAGVMPNDVTFTSVMRGCGDLGDFRLGMCVLGLIAKVGFEKNLSVSNSLISFSLRLGVIDLARRIFDEMVDRDVVSWTAILDMYVEMDALEEAQRVFDGMPEKNEVSWSVMISRYSQRGQSEKAVLLFLQMVQSGLKPSISCLSSTVNALANLTALLAGQSVHSYVIKLGVEENVFICCSLVDFYCKCAHTEDGRRVFDSTMKKNVACWNSMVTGYGLNGQLEEAKEMFDKMPHKNTISWNALIASYLGCDQFDKVLEVFNNMLLSELPSKSSFSSVLCACASLSSLEKGKSIHGKIVKFCFQYDMCVGTALLDMYSKSGNIECSHKVFDRMTQRNEISWTAMIQGLAENGYAEESLALFEEMQKSSSFNPNELILSSVLFACSHRGLVDKGLQYFNSMEKVYGIKPNDRHYTCVVDMFSRAGRFSEAEGFISKMPYEPEANAWAALLSGCRTYGNDKLAEKAAGKIIELEEKKAGGYVLLSNIYASVGRWYDVMNTRRQMKDIDLPKSGGCSWIEVRNENHVFYSQDGTHIHSTEVFGVLELLMFEMMLF